MKLFAALCLLATTVSAFNVGASSKVLATPAATSRPNVFMGSTNAPPPQLGDSRRRRTSTEVNRGMRSSGDNQDGEVLNAIFIFGAAGAFVVAGLGFALVTADFAG